MIMSMDMKKSGWGRGLSIGVFILTFVLVETCFIPGGQCLTLPADYSPEPSRVRVVEQTGEEFTVFDLETGVYGVFQNGPGEFLPSLIGEVEEGNGQTTLIPKLEIRSWGDYYTLSDPSNPEFLQVVEKLKEGGFGRLLRYRGFTPLGEWVDVEFIYEDRAQEVTLLDHLAGRFFQTTFTEPLEDPLSVAPAPDTDHGFGEMLSILIHSIKFSAVSGGVIGLYHPSVVSIGSQIFTLPEKDLWARRQVRGPPGEVLPS